MSGAPGRPPPVGGASADQRGGSDRDATGHDPRKQTDCGRCSWTPRPPSGPATATSGERCAPSGAVDATRRTMRFSGSRSPSRPADADDAAHEDRRRPRPACAGPARSVPTGRAPAGGRGRHRPVARPRSPWWSRTSGAVLKVDEGEWSNRCPGAGQPRYRSPHRADLSSVVAPGPLRTVPAQRRTPYRGSAGRGGGVPRTAPRSTERQRSPRARMCPDGGTRPMVPVGAGTTRSTTGTPDYKEVRPCPDMDGTTSPDRYV